MTLRGTTLVDACALPLLSAAHPLSSRNGASPGPTSQFWILDFGFWIEVVDRECWFPVVGGYSKIQNRKSKIGSPARLTGEFGSRMVRWLGWCRFCATALLRASHQWRALWGSGDVLLLLVAFGMQFQVVCANYRPRRQPVKRTEVQTVLPEAGVGTGSPRPWGSRWARSPRPYRAHSHSANLITRSARGTS